MSRGMKSVLGLGLCVQTKVRTYLRDNCKSLRSYGEGVAKG
jgi:hypothetical protein